MKLSSRAASAMNGAGANWPCSGVRRRIASAGGMSQRSIRPWRAASATVSSWRVRTRKVVSVRCVPWPSPSRFLTPTATRPRCTSTALPRRSSSSPATTARTRSPGMNGIQAVARDYADRGVRVLQISSNDAVKLPARFAGGDARAGRRGRVRGAVPVRRVAGGRARVGRQDDAARVRHRRFGRGLQRCAGRRPRRPVAERRVAARGAWTTCSPGGRSRSRRPSRWGARSSGE